MGAGVAASPHFPGLQSASREGSPFLNRADRSSSQSCDRRASDRVPDKSREAFAGPPSKPRRTLLPAEASFASTGRDPSLPDDPESGSGFGLRLGLTLLPLRPFAASSSPGLAAGFARASPRFEHLFRFRLAALIAKPDSPTFRRVAQAFGACG